MSEFITFKRWALRDGQQESELIRLVREEIVPHFERLPGCLGLGLLRIAGTRSYLALQLGKIATLGTQRSDPTATNPGMKRIRQRLSAGTNS